jgi:hypothetical protein
VSASVSIAFKVKRDLLIASTILIFINLAQVEITGFTFGVTSGNINAPELAYLIIFFVWAYFGYRHFVFNRGGFWDLVCGVSIEGTR